VPAEALAELLQLHLLYATSDLDLRAVIKVTGLGALQPHVLAIVFCHDYDSSESAEFRVQDAE
jgi:hypothetical protein